MFMKLFESSSKFGVISRPIFLYIWDMELALMHFSPSLVNHHWTPKIIIPENHSDVMSQPLTVLRQTRATLLAGEFPKEVSWFSSIYSSRTSHVVRYYREHIHFNMPIWWPAAGCVTVGGQFINKNYAQSALAWRTCQRLYIVYAVGRHNCALNSIGDYVWWRRWHHTHLGRRAGRHQPVFRV